MKALRIGLLTLLGLITVAIAAIVVFVATFDANRYKPEIEQMVLDQTGRVLDIEGDINLTVLPNIGADLGRVTLSEKNATRAFLTIDSASVSVALLPLLSDQVLIDGLTIDGLTATVTRATDGGFNVDDILNKIATVDAAADPVSNTGGSTEGTKTSPLQLDIGAIKLTNANLRYINQRQDQDLQFNDLNLKTGQIAETAQGSLSLSATVRSDSSSLDTELSVTGDYTLRLAEQRINLSALTLDLNGEWQDFKAIESTIELNLASHLETGTHTLSDVSGSVKAQLSNDTTETTEAIELNVQSKQVVATASGLNVEPVTLKLDLTGQAQQVATALNLPAFEFAQKKLQLDAWTAQVSINDATWRREPLLVSVQGDLSLDTATEKLRTQLQGQFDDAPIQATLGLRGFAEPAMTFDVRLDQLHLDRFAIGPQTQVSASRANGTSSAKPTGTNDTPPETAIDLSGLKGHHINGQLLIKAVRAKQATMTDVQAQVALNQGRLVVSPHSASLLGGKLSGDLLIDANNNQFQLKETVNGIALESLLEALGQAPRVTGEGSLSLDLTSRGQTVQALARQLAGKASLNLQNGAVKGIDIGSILNNVRSMLGKAPTQQGEASGQTTFTELTGSVDIKQGIATNQDLSMKAPLFRLLGSGTFDIPQTTLDFRAKVAVVETSTGQGGADLAALRGVTVPIRIQGTPENLTYRVDVAGLAAELAKSQLGNKAKEEINRVVPGLGDALKGLFGR